MRKALFLVIAFIALNLQSNAQVMEWYTYWGSNVAGSQIRPIRMVVDNDGFIYTSSLFGGSNIQILDQTVPSLSGVDLGDAIITKMNPEKVAIWSRKLVASGSASVSDIVIDKQNNLIVTGTFKGTLQADPTTTMTMEDPTGYAELAIFVIRYNQSGHALNMWQLPAEEATVNSVSVDGENNIIISGTFGSEISFDPNNLNNLVGSTQHFNQMYVAKYAATGNLIWSKYQQSSSVSYVNSFSKSDNDGNIFVTGGFTGAMTLAGLEISTGSAVNDLFLVKYSATGEETWAKHIKGSRNDLAAGIEISPAGDVAVLSNYYSEDITITGVTDTLHNNFRNLTGTAGQYHIAVYTFKSDNGDYRWWYSYGQGSTAGGGGAVGSYIRCTEEGVWYVGGAQSSRFGDLYTFDNFANSNSGIKTVDGVWMQHNTNGGNDALHLVLTREGKLASIGRPGGKQTESIKDIALSPDKKHIYMMYDIKIRAALMYTCVDNMFDSFIDLHDNFPERKSMYNLIQVYSPETPVNNTYTTNVGFTSTIVAKYKFPEIDPHELPTYTSGAEYSQILAINLPAGVPKFYQLSIPEVLNFTNNTLSGTISGTNELTFGVLVTDSTANPGTITYYAQDPNKVSIRGRSRNVRYMSLKAKDDTSVKSLLAANATFYPAVTSDVLNIKTTETMYVVNLYNQVGQLIGKYNNPTSISVRNLPTGLYHAQLKSMTGAVKTAKFIIE